MTGLVVYGSLMAKAEITALGLSPDNATPVMLQGFRREFSQEPSWRQGQGVQRAVLTLVRSPGRSVNVILLQSLSDAMITQLDIRERGYDRVRIEPSCLSGLNPNDSFALASQATVVTYLGKREKRNQNLLPNPQYLERCQSAAKDWGEEFFQLFGRNLLSGSRQPEL